jgi:hypothetical protein
LVYCVKKKLATLVTPARLNFFHEEVDCQSFVESAPESEFPGNGPFRAKVLRAAVSEFAPFQNSSLLQDCQRVYFHTKKIGYISERLRMKSVGIFYGYWVNFIAIWHIWWSYGVVLPFREVVPRKIWQH